MIVLAENNAISQAVLDNSPSKVRKLNIVLGVTNTGYGETDRFVSLGSAYTFSQQPFSSDTALTRQYVPDANAPKLALQTSLGFSIGGEAVSLVKDARTGYEQTLTDAELSPWLIPSPLASGGASVSAGSYRIQLVQGRYYENACTFEGALSVSVKGSLPVGMTLTGNTVSGSPGFNSAAQTIFTVDGSDIVVIFDPVVFPVTFSS